MERQYARLLGRCRGRAWMHYEGARVCKKQQACLVIPSLVMSGSAGTIIFVMFTNAWVPTWQVSVVLGSMNLASTVLTAISTRLDLSVKMEKNASLAREFESLARAVENTAGPDELRAYEARYDMLVRRNGIVPDAVADRYRALVHEGHLDLPSLEEVLHNIPDASVQTHVAIEI